MVSLSERIEQKLLSIPEDRRRSLKGSIPLAGGRVERGSRILLNFASNDYLDLSHHPLLIERSSDWAKDYGTGSGASRLITGNHSLYEKVERRLADLKGAETALILNSGFQANASVLSTLLNRSLNGGRENPNILLFTDKLNHASLHFGSQAANAKQIRFRHNDLNHLEQLLSKYQDDDQAKIIVTESVFSMDGDELDVAAIRMLAKRHDAFLYIDEAHATGVLGKNGMGLCAGGVSRDELVMGTFGKGLGSYGAYVACSQNVRDYLINACSGLIYATALPPQVLGAIDAALELVPRLDDERLHLKEIGNLFRGILQKEGLDTGLSSTQIIPVVIGSDQQTMAVANKLEEKGFLVGAIRPPTVPEGTARLRVTLSAVHTEEQVISLAKAIVMSCKEADL
ncbi:aminotransferase class I/II-fold pyridoxal phosphate-dependent enzyme [Kiloniella sp.]|uniref:aminotransferase class I/II-fold pyridoxal phosphate-dependent enzyme n=1 Tax=Kiloniella sp. TaxID=1938587 RepID=UPI003B017A14